MEHDSTVEQMAYKVGNGLVHSRLGKTQCFRSHHEPHMLLSQQYLSQGWQRKSRGLGTTALRPNFLGIGGSSRRQRPTHARRLKNSTRHVVDRLTVFVSSASSPDPGDNISNIAAVHTACIALPVESICIDEEAAQHASSTSHPP